MDALVLLSLLLAPKGGEPSVFNEDPRMLRPIKVPARVRVLNEVAGLIGDKTGREFLIHPSVPEIRLFAASQAVSPGTVLDELTPFLSDKTYLYRWLRRGGGERPRYELIRRAKDPDREVADAKQEFIRALARAGSFDPVAASRRQITANDAGPARYGLVKSLPQHVLRPAVDRALRGERVVLPLKLFNKTTLHAAHGKVMVMAKHRVTGEVRTTFSWQDVDRGHGFVVLERDHQRRDGPLGLRLTIGSGDPPPPGKGIEGPSSELIYGLPPSRQGNLTPASPSGEAVKPQEPAARVTIRAKAPLDNGEDVLGNALRQLSDAAHLLVLSRWSGSTKPSTERLPADIVNAPVADAAQRIAAHFKLTCRVSKRSIWFKGPTSDTKTAARPPAK